MHERACSCNLVVQTISSVTQVNGLTGQPSCPFVQAGSREQSNKLVLCIGVIVHDGKVTLQHKLPMLICLDLPTGGLAPCHVRCPGMICRRIMQSASASVWPLPLQKDVSTTTSQPPGLHAVIFMLQCPASPCACCCSACNLISEASA